ncbi:MAG: hypothetical protein KDD19_22560, partial [Phaeodactylibacter sp.]|nr:hypothetical protein [Phaeodactylibacter sp.]
KAPAVPQQATDFIVGQAVARRKVLKMEILLRIRAQTPKNTGKQKSQTAHRFLNWLFVSLQPSKLRRLSLIAGINL